MSQGEGDRVARDLRRRRERRRLWIAMAASTLIHIAAAQVGWWTGPASYSGGGPAVPGDEWAALRIIDVRAVEGPSGPDENSVETREVAAEPTDVPPATASPVPSNAGGPPAPSPPSAATRLRTAAPNPLLYGPPTRPLPTEAAAQSVVSAAVADLLARPPEVPGRDSLQHTVWGDDDAELRLAPGVLFIGGVALPFCGGADAARCGFGARPWDLEKADREAAFLRGLEEQGRWEAIQERAREMRRRAGARRDTTSGGGLDGRPEAI